MLQPLVEPALCKLVHTVAQPTQNNNTRRMAHLHGCAAFFPVRCRRREAVRAATKHAWDSYVQYAWGYDELCPLNKSGKNTFGGLGATIVDSLDTLWLLGESGSGSRLPDPT